MVNNMKNTQSLTNLNEGHRKRLRERFINEGIENFDNYQVLELLLTLSDKRRDVRPIAKELINIFGSLNGVMNATIKELTSIKGIGNIAAHNIKLVKAIAEYLPREKFVTLDILSSVNAVKDFCKIHYAALKNEELRCIFLNNQNILIKEQLLQKGTSTNAIFEYSTLLKKIFHFNATGIILIHNHPSGTTEFSQADINMTRDLSDFLKRINIRLLDHFLYAKNKIISMKALSLF